MSEQERMLFRGCIKDMGPYKPPLEGRSLGGFLLLDFNERTKPPHPLVREAVERYACSGELHVYPEYGKLDHIVEKHAGVESGQVIVTNGSDQGIDMIYRALVEKGDEVILTAPTFAMLEQSALVQGAKLIRPRYQGENLDFPYDEVMQSIGKDTKLVVLCNPNSPTGTTIKKEKSEEIIKRANEFGACVMVDEAYHEFSPELTVADLVDKYSKLFVTRSFSKTLGIPSLRAGYVVSQERNIGELNKIRGPYDVNMFAVVAMLTLSNPAVVDDMRQYVREVMEVSKPILEAFYMENGVRFYPSGANFHLIEAEGLEDFLRSKGILIRPRKDPPGTVRVSIGTREDTGRYINAFTEYLKERAA